MSSVPDWLQDAVERYLHDLQEPTPIRLRIDTWEDGEALAFLERGGGSGFWLATTNRGPELVVELADFLQDQVFPESREAWGEARPACPGHTHPASPELVDGEAWWTCPHSGRRLCVIGLE
jgi:hypothetical protein